MGDGMQVVILAGGLGTRLSEETQIKPKPMVEIGERPMLWHIMKHYAHYGHREFFIALGYKGDVIKRFFLDYYSMSSDMTVELGSGVVRAHDKKQTEDWIVHLVDTGDATNTGGRLKRLEPLLKREPFMLTYGDGVSSVPLPELVAFHRAQKKLATVSAVRPPARFGGLIFDGNLVVEFDEKPQIGEGWINGGFMVMEQGVFQYLEGDATSLESHALDRLANDRQLTAYRHEGFWQCMDTLREVRLLERLWHSGDAPWKLWT